MKNKFKTPKITYAPIKQAKKPYWMQSVQRATPSKDKVSAIGSAITISVTLAIMVTLIYIGG